MFKNNMKFTRAACWINAKISNRDKNTTLTIFLFCHCYWSLWCNYWKPLKSDSHLPKNCFICFNESLLKIMNNAFYFISKPHLVRLIFIFLCWLFVHVKNRLIRRIRLISKFMTSQTGWQTIAIHVLHKISGIKGNQTIKFGQVIEYNKKFSSKNHAKNEAGRLVPDLLFFKTA